MFESECRASASFGFVLLGGSGGAPVGVLHPVFWETGLNSCLGAFLRYLITAVLVKKKKKIMIFVTLDQANIYLRSQCSWLQ